MHQDRAAGRDEEYYNEGAPQTSCLKGQCLLPQQVARYRKRGRKVVRGDKGY